MIAPRSRDLMILAKNLIFGAMIERSPDEPAVRCPSAADETCVAGRALALDRPGGSQRRENKRFPCSSGSIPPELHRRI